MSIRTKPTYCQYSAGACDQPFDNVPSPQGLFLYPSEPSQVAQTIERTAEQLSKGGQQWITWKEIGVGGQIIFCRVCQAMRFAKILACDVTTLSFNLMFEIGYGLGLRQPILPIRDTSIVHDKREFDTLGLLDTVGYLDFQNSEMLTEKVRERVPTATPVAFPDIERSTTQPLYVVRDPVTTDGTLRLMSVLKKSPVRFRTYDPQETPRLTLHEAMRQVASSYGVVVHLLGAGRKGARVHNARCALISGLAMAQQKHVLILHESDEQQPIDYRDVVRSYANIDQIEKHLEPILRATIEALQEQPHSRRRQKKLLEKIDLGDLAAENEIASLPSYYYATASFNEARRGRARLVVGRKGTGKTALFYQLRRDLVGKRNFVLDLKPEGHQFTELRETVLNHLSPGLKEHTVASFWNSILLCELANKIVDNEYSWSLRDPDRMTRYTRVSEAYEKHKPAIEGDFSTRLLDQVKRLARSYDASGGITEPSAISEKLFSQDIPELADAVGGYLEEKSEVWLLMDNLDKGWPTKGATSEDVLLVRSLLSATRSLQRELQKREVEFHCMVFLRTDLYEHLIRDTPDKGKDSVVSLEWSDPEALKEVLRRRLVLQGGEDDHDFETVWSRVFDPLIGTQHSFQYIVERTLMRPRDLIGFARKAIDVAVNRGHDRVQMADLEQAERDHSDDMLQGLAFELIDSYPEFDAVLDAFIGEAPELSEEDLNVLLEAAGVPPERVSELRQLLLWFGFLGVKPGDGGDSKFAYALKYNLKKLQVFKDRHHGSYVIHPAFRTALECQ